MHQGETTADEGAEEPEADHRGTDRRGDMPTLQATDDRPEQGVQQERHGQRNAERASDVERAEPREGGQHHEAHRLCPFPTGHQCLCFPVVVCSEDMAGAQSSSNPRRHIATRGTRGRACRRVRHAGPARGDDPSCPPCQRASAVPARPLRTPGSPSSGGPLRAAAAGRQ